MENPSQKCEICAQAGLNQTKLLRHYIRRKFKAETHLELSDEDMCAKCLFEIERDMFIYLTCSIRPMFFLSTVIRLFLASLLPYVYLQLSSRVHTVCSI